MATKKQISKTSVVDQAKAPVTTTKTAAKKTAAPKAEKVAPAAKKTTEAKAPVAKKAAPAPAVKKVTFALPKEAVENAETVALVGDFCNWDVTKAVALKKQKDGSFKTAVELESGRAYQYRFLINGATWENAWDAEAYEPTPFGGYNSVVKA